MTTELAAYIMESMTQSTCKFTARDTRLAQESIKLDHEIKKLTARKKTIDAELLGKMSAQGAFLATYRTSTVAERVHWTRRGLDGAKIRLEIPDADERFAKPSEGYRIEYLLAI